MGRPPAYVFVVRHGNRLDAADKQWHLTSPAPYDPPLTYGGWLQCRTLGARIASILQDRDAEEEAAAAAAGRPRKKRRYNVVIHTSPFLRCIQTSVAISAGLASNPSPSNSLSSTPTGDQSPRVRPTRAIQMSSFSNAAPPLTRSALAGDINSNFASNNHAHIEKSVLRLDPFLGEWASPDYFEHITPPPRSSLMVMTAIAELLRKEDYNNYPHFTAKPAVVSSTPSQLWNSPQIRSPLATHAESAEGDGEFPSLEGLSDALPPPQLDRANAPPSRIRSVSDVRPPPGYTAPVPPYAVSPSDSIPDGYVAHARDACVRFDYQWDSSRQSLGWGDGGELPEEWAAMHQRFRRGLRRLVEWYATTEQPGDMVTKVASSPNNGNAVDNSDDVETENIVILVSHGAGCNALVGGVTNQPVLADVPMASLTVARRRAEYDGRDSVDAAEIASIDDAFSRRRMSVPDMYEMTMFANTEHLTSGGSMSRSSSLSGGSRGLFTGTLAPSSPVGRSNSVNASLGSMRRTSQSALAMKSLNEAANLSKGNGITVGSGVTSFAKPTRQNSWGMWQPKQDRADDLPMTLDFGSHREPRKDVPESPASSKAAPSFRNISPKAFSPKVASPKAVSPKAVSPRSASPQVLGSPKMVHLPVQPPETAVMETPRSPSSASEERDQFDEDPFVVRRGSKVNQLWGSPLPPGEAERQRDFTSQKRRWTVNER